MLKLPLEPQGRSLLVNISRRTSTKHQQLHSTGVIAWQRYHCSSLLLTNTTGIILVSVASELPSIVLLRNTEQQENQEDFFHCVPFHLVTALSFHTTDCTSHNQRLRQMDTSFRSIATLPNVTVQMDIWKSVLRRWNREEPQFRLVSSSQPLTLTWFFPFSVRMLVTFPKGRPSAITSVSDASLGSFLM